MAGLVAAYAARRDLAPAPVSSVLSVVLLAAVIAPSVRLALAHLERGRRWSDPNPRRSGFATSTAPTMLDATRAVTAQPTLS